MKNDSINLLGSTERFEKVRTAHLSENTEDYVELIDDLIKDNKIARSVDIARCLGVSKPTVSKTLNRLDKEGFVNAKSYQPITLTDKGKKLADYCRNRHTIILNFLLALGVTKDIAEIDAEGMEHHTSMETLKLFQEFIDKNK